MRGYLIGPALAALAALAGGCGSQALRSGGPEHVSPWLVLGGPGLGGAAARPGDPSAPEYGRNDGRMNASAEPAARRYQAAVIQTRDELRTDNGTPREFSTTLTRTITTTAIP